MRGYAPPKSFENLGLLQCIFCILEQELGYLNRKGNSDHLIREKCSVIVVIMLMTCGDLLKRLTTLQTFGWPGFHVIDDWSVL